MPDLATVTGKVLKPTGAVLANAYIKFVLKNVGTDDTVSPAEVYPRGYSVEGLTDATGVLKASDGTSDLELWVNANSGVDSVYEISFPDRRETVSVIIPASASGGTIDLEELIENHQTVASSTQQGSVLDAAKTYTNVFAADPSNNTSFVALAWRADLGLGSAALEESSVFQERSERNQASGYAGLNSAGMLDSSVFPAFFVTGGIEFSQIFSGDYVSGGTTS